MKILDLYCSAGGISRGIADAAVKFGVQIHITGVDLYRQRNWIKSIEGRCEGEFIQADAIPFLIEALKTGQFDYIHASPPCKGYTSVAHLATQKNQADRQLEMVRDILRERSIPYQIENVAGTPIRPDIELVGYQFGLKTIRKRRFELGNWFMMSHCLPQKIGSQRGGDFLAVVGKGGYSRREQKEEWVNYQKPPKWTTGSAVKDRRIALGIDWMTSAEMSQAIPPAYAEYIFTHYLKQL